MRTFEERLKFDSGLAVGRQLVRFTLGDQARLALVDISPRGVVRWLVKPDDGDMYSAWSRLRGDKSTNDGAVVVWGARDPEYMRQFDGEPVATVPVVPA